MGLEVFFVIGIFGDPDISDGQLQSRIGIGQDRDPLIGVDRGCVVEVRTDIDRLYAELFEPVHHSAADLAGPAPVGGLRVGSPIKHKLSVFGQIVDDIGLRWYSHRLATPDMLASPVPTLPGIRIAGLLSISAQKRQEFAGTAVGGVDDLGLTVAVRLRKNGVRTILLPNALQLTDHDIQGFVPGNTLIPGKAPGSEGSSLPRGLKSILFMGWRIREGE